MTTYIACYATIDELYESMFTDNKEKKFKVSAEFKESHVPFSVILMGRDKTPDCKISSFVENIYFRTRNGQNRKRYESIEALRKAIERVAKKYGYTLKRIIIEKGEPSLI